MLTLLGLAFDLAIEWCSWRLLFCIVLAIVMIAALYYKFPEHDGFWPLSGIVGAIIIVLGIVWERRANR